MSGLLGFMGEGERDRHRVLEAMVEAVPLCLAARHAPWMSPDGCIGFSVERRSALPGPLDHAYDPDAGLFCVLDGTAWPLGEGRTNGFGPRPARRLLEEFRHSGVEALRRVGGNFNVAWWSEGDRVLTLATDRTGYRHLYYRTEGRDVVFSTWLGPVLAGSASAAAFDPESIADFISFRYLPGNRTLYQGVRILPPAGVLIATDSTVQVGRYWRIDEIEPSGRYDDDQRQRLDDALRRAVRRCVADPPARTVIALTGGLDSRTILATALAEGIDVRAITNGVEEGTDLILARDLAARAGVDHTFEEVDVLGLADLIPVSVALGSASAPDLKPHSSQAGFGSSPDRVVTGIVGNVMRHALLWRLPDASLGPVLDTSRKNARSGTAKRMDVSELWVPEFRSMAAQAPLDHLEEVHRSYDLSYRPAKLAAYMSIEQSGRRGLGRANVSHGWQRDVGNPFLDPDLLEVVLSLPVRERIVNPIQMELIARHAPPLLDVPFNKPKGPFIESDMALKLHVRGRTMIRRLRRRLRVPVPSSVPSFPYETWHRGPMRDALEVRILRPDAVWRRYLDPARIIPMVDEHFAGHRPWYHLVSGLTILEVAAELWGG